MKRVTVLQRLRLPKLANPYSAAPSDVNSCTKDVVLTRTQFILCMSTLDAAKGLTQSMTVRGRDVTAIDAAEHLSLVEQEAKYFCRSRPATYSLEYGDFYGAGCVGLMEAAEKWVPGLTSAPFSAYARKWIRGHMYKLLRQELKAHCRGEPMWPKRRPAGEGARDRRPGRHLLQIDDIETSVPDEVGTEETVLLQILLERLPEIEHQVLFLLYMAGYDGKDTARILGLKGGSSVISVIKKRATQRLRDWFGIPSNLRHGSLDAYRYCKCEICREEKAKKNSEEWKRRKEWRTAQARGRGKSGAAAAAQDGLEIADPKRQPDGNHGWEGKELEKDTLALAS